MRKKFVKGCIIFVLCCLMGCGQSGNPAEGTVPETATTENMTEEEEMEEEDNREAEEAAAPEDEDTAQKAERVSKTVSGELSDDLFSFQIQVGEDVFTLPMTYQDLTDKGYVCAQPDQEELEAGLYLVRQEFVKGDTVLFVGIVNLTGDTQPIESCSAVSIGVDEFYMAGENYADIILPKGLQFKVSSKEEVIAAYGEPDESSEESEEMEYSTIVYSKDFYQSVKMTIDNERNVICAIDMENMPE